MKSPIIKWFRNPANKKRLLVKITEEGQFLIDSAFYNELPESLCVGSHMNTRRLYIREGGKEEYELCFRKQKKMIVSELLRELEELNIRLPLTFEFDYDDKKSYWRGEMIPQSHNGVYDKEQLAIIYNPLIEKLCRNYAATTPEEDRKQNALEALFNAISKYKRAYGDLKSFLEAQIIKTLKWENKTYVKHSRTISLQKTLKEDDENFILQGVIGIRDDRLALAELKMDINRFQRTLPSEEADIFDMLVQGKTYDDIASRLKISTEEVKRILKSVRDKWKRFYNED